MQAREGCRGGTAPQKSKRALALACRTHDKLTGGRHACIGGERGRGYRGFRFCCIS